MTGSRRVSHRVSQPRHRPARVTYMTAAARRLADCCCCCCCRHTGRRCIDVSLSSCVGADLGLDEGREGRKRKVTQSRKEEFLSVSHSNTLSAPHLTNFLVAVATQAKALRVPQRRVQQVSAASLSALLASSSHLISLSPSLTFCTSGLGRSIPASDCQPRSSRRRSQRLVFFF